MWQLVFKKLSPRFKIFENLIFNKMFIFFNEINLISPKQSGFKPRD